MNDRERCAWETMVAWREARAVAEPRSRQWEEFNREFKLAEVEYYRARD
jgi:hypothetical protein